MPALCVKIAQVELQKQGLTVLHAPSLSEGSYIRVPEDKTLEDMVINLTEINRNVRRRFRDMPRANKSRLQFKYEPIVVPPNSDQIPELVRTQSGTYDPGWAYVCLKCLKSFQNL